jgi:hypothetical protein
MPSWRSPKYSRGVARRETDHQILLDEQRGIEIAQLDRFVDARDLTSVSHNLLRVRPAEHYLASDPIRGPVNVWRVFTERAADGYSVVFDPGLSMFGLTVGSGDKTVLIGVYGTLADAIESM